MADSKIKLDRYAVIARLIELIDEFPDDQLLLLLKHMTRGRVKTYVSQLVMDIPEQRRVTLLKQLEAIKLELGRKGERKPCEITVDYTIQDNTFKDYIQDVSTQGVFIKSKEKLSIGQEVRLSFVLPNSKDPLEIAGKVVRCEKDGYGVKFMNMGKYSEDIIESFLEEKAGL